MKRLYFLSLMCLLPFAAKAQNGYHPFIEEGKVWQCYVTWGMQEDNTEKAYYAIGTDTIVNGIACKKLGWYAIYEKDGKVYCHDREDGNFHLLYDFTCREGDILDIVNPIERSQARCTIEKVDTILTRSGLRLKRFLLAAEIMEEGEAYPCREKYVWIEGVGSPYMPLYSVGYWDEIAGGSSFVSSCAVDGEVFFVYNDIKYGTDGIGIIRDGRNEKMRSNAAYDLSGRRTDKPTKGIYIQNGRKWVVE